MRTRQAGRARRSWAAAASPSRPGISMSSRATSGLTSSARGTTSSPRPASATTSMSPSSPRRAVSAPRTRPWSSAISTRITRGSPLPSGRATSNRKPPPATGPGLEAAPEGLDALGQAGETRSLVRPRLVRRPAPAPGPSSVMVASAHWPRRSMRIRTWCAPLWRTTLVMPSLTVQASTASTIGGRPSSTVLDRRSDVGRRQHLAGRGQLPLQRRTPVPADRVADRHHRLTGDPLDVLDLAFGPFRLVREGAGWRVRS